MNRQAFFLFSLLLALLLAGCTPGTHAGNTAGNTDEVDKQTYTFAIKGKDTLRLDKYEQIGTPGDTAIKPVILFAFGGGFKGGERDNESYIPYFRFLARNGYVVVSTDYRTGLKGIAPSGMTDPGQFASALQNAIGMAVTDFFDATRYILDNSEAWKINPRQIIASGSSAGAVTTLQAEYELCNRTPLTQKLPSTFQYAGVISFAGAICSAGEPEWKEAPCPLMLFHGDADPVVPFDKALLNDMGLWGSHFIAGQMQEKQYPYFLYVVENAGHEIAGLPMDTHRYDILSFLNRFVKNQQQAFIRTTETLAGRPEAKKDFTLQDYLQHNL